MLLSVVRELPPRDCCLITAQWFTGFRISEIRSLTAGSVVRSEEIVSKIGVASWNMKGGYGRTRWIPVLPELRPALVSDPTDIRIWDTDPIKTPENGSQWPNFVYGYFPHHDVTIISSI
jgi:hypothetical protein